MYLLHYTFYHYFSVLLLIKKRICHVFLAITSSISCLQVSLDHNKRTHDVVDVYQLGLCSCFILHSLRMECRTLCSRDKCSTPEPHPQPHKVCGSTLHDVHTMIQSLNGWHTSQEHIPVDKGLMTIIGVGVTWAMEFLKLSQMILVGRRG